MRKFLALCTMIFLWCTANLTAAPAFDTGNQAQTTIAPSDNDAGQSAIQISVAYLQPVAILYDAPDLQTAEHSFWDIGLQQNVGTSKNPREEKGFTTGMKEVLTVFDNNGGNSANSTATWTADDYDIGAWQHFFFLNTRGAQTSAPIPGFFLRC